MEMKRLYKSRTDRKISGVCGGVAEYLGIDPTVIRLLTIFFSLFGAGLLVYIIAAFVVPEAPVL